MQVTYKGKKINLPDFLIIGAAKSATTSMHYYLKDDSRFYLPEVKESYFFSFRNLDIKYTSPDDLPDKVSSEEKYFSLFENANQNQVIGEASPSYLYTYEFSINNIKEIYGEEYKKLKIIGILRNPIDRAYSQYMMFRRENNENKTFYEAIQVDNVKERVLNGWNLFYDYLGFGMYFKQVKAYKENFENIKIYLYDDFVNNEESIMKDIAIFLGVKDFKLDKTMKFNVSGVPRKKFLHYLIYKPNIFKAVFKFFIAKSTRTKVKFIINERNLKKEEMPIEARKYLVNYYEEDIKKLEIVLKKDLSRWVMKNEVK